MSGNDEESTSENSPSLSSVQRILPALFVHLVSSETLRRIDMRCSKVWMRDSSRCRCFNRSVFCAVDKRRPRDLICRRSIILTKSNLLGFHGVQGKVSHCDISIASPSVIVATVPVKSRRSVSFSVSWNRTSARVGTIPGQHPNGPHLSEAFRSTAHLLSGLRHIFPWPYRVPA